MFTLEKGTQAQFVEIEQKDEVKRFLVPTTEGLEGRLRALIQQKPQLSLVRIGRAIIASKDEMTPLTDGLDGVPSEVTGTYVLDLCGEHPVLDQGPARYSESFIQAIQALHPVEVVYQAPEKGQMSTYDITAQSDGGTAVAAKPDLAASLRAQMEQQVPAQTAVITPPENALQAKLNEKLQQQKELPVAQKSEIEIVTTPKVVPLGQSTFPEVDKKASFAETLKETQRQLEEARERSEAEKKTSSVSISHRRPQGKLDIILEQIGDIKSLLIGEPQADDISPEELESWFEDHVSTVGRKRTFELLANRLKD